MRLTYRQVACLWERYWDRHIWGLEVQTAMNPLVEKKDEASYDSLEEIFNQPAIDITAPGSEHYLEQELGIKVKRRPKRS